MDRTAPPAWRHVPALDGLRGVAVLAVLAFHADHLRGGFLGVDLFFTLSGFLITSLLLDEAATSGSVDLVGFWGRRFRRLLPAAVAVLVAVLLATWAFGSPAQLDSVHRSGPAALAYLANWQQIGEEAGYWASFADPSPLTHLWSLAIEEQFYVLWPVVFLGLWRLGRGRPGTVAAVALAGAACSAIAMVVLYEGGDPTRVYMGTDTRAASILFGAAIAATPWRRFGEWCVTVSRRTVDAVLLLLVVVGAVAWWRIDGASSAGLFEGGLPLHAAIAAVLVAGVAVDDRLVVSRLFSVRVLTYVGTRSYGLYLWHWPVYVVLDGERTGLDGWALTVVRVAVSFAFAEASFRLIESPVRRRWAWARGRSGAIAAIGAIGVAALLYALVPDASAEIARFDPASITAAPTAPSAAAPVATSIAPPDRPLPLESLVAPTAPAVVTTVTTVAPRAAVDSVRWMGDSVAWDAAPGIEAALLAGGVRTEVAAFVGLGVVPNHGFDPIELFVDPAGSEPTDLAVLMLSEWDLQFEELEQRESLAALSSAVRGRGTILAVVPPPPIDPELGGRDYTVLLDEAGWLAASDPGIIVLDPSGVWGEQYVRDMDGDGTPERKTDGVHLCPSGVARFAAWLVDELAARYDGIVPSTPGQWAGLDWVSDSRYNEPLGVCS